MKTKVAVVTTEYGIEFESGVNGRLAEFQERGCEVISVQYQMVAHAKYGNDETIVYSALITYREPSN